MIEDLEGATPESARGLKVVAVSAVCAAISLIVLIHLFVPQAQVSMASPAPSSVARTVPFSMVFSSDSQMLTGGVALTQARSCSERTPLAPPFYFAFEDGTGRILAVSPGATTSRLPVAAVARLPGGVTVICTTPGMNVPWDAIAR